jgi:hypothetical protein
MTTPDETEDVSGAAEKDRRGCDARNANGEGQRDGNGGEDAVTNAHGCLLFRSSIETRRPSFHATFGQVQLAATAMAA